MQDNDYQANVEIRPQWHRCDIITNDNVESGTMLMRTDSYFKGTHQDKILGSNGNIFPLALGVHTFIATYSERDSFQLLSTVFGDYSPDIVIDSFITHRVGKYSNIRRDNIEFFVAGELLLDGNYLFVTPEVVDMNNRSKAEAIVIGKNQQIELPDLIADNAGRVCIMAKLYSPVDGKIKILYKQSDNQYKNYEEIEVGVDKGDNYIYLPIYGKADKTFHLMIGLPNNGQEYVFYNKPSVKDILAVDQTRD